MVLITWLRSNLCTNFPSKIIPSSISPHQLQAAVYIKHDFRIFHLKAFDCNWKKTDLWELTTFIWNCHPLFTQRFRWLQSFVHILYYCTHVIMSTGRSGVYTCSSVWTSINLLIWISWILCTQTVHINWTLHINKCADFFKKECFHLNYICFMHTFFFWGGVECDTFT